MTGSGLGAVAGATARDDALTTQDIEALIEPLMQEAVAALGGSAPLLAGMVRYHLGDVDQELRPVAGAIDRGKRVRPSVALLAAGATGGNPGVAAPIAAALELLHNFTLIHDDIQDESPTRRHRPTVWSLWGSKQAINAGDALFAAAHLPLYALPSQGASADLTMRLLAAFDRMTIAIVEGQTIDLQFEERSDVTPGEYLTMIGGKTAAIVRYAAWAGAVLGGANEADAACWDAFGLALGLGFQIHDDQLGIWGATAETGKAPADDIRRRKKSLPVLLLRQRLAADERAHLDALYARESIDAAGTAEVLRLLAREGIQDEVAREVARYHDRAALALAATSASDTPYRQQLAALIARLASRTG